MLLAPYYSGIHPTLVDGLYYATTRLIVLKFDQLFSTLHHNRDKCSRGVAFFCVQIEKLREPRDEVSIHTTG